MWTVHLWYYYSDTWLVKIISQCVHTIQVVLVMDHVPLHCESFLCIYTQKRDSQQNNYTGAELMKHPTVCWKTTARDSRSGQCVYWIPNALGHKQCLLGSRAVSSVCFHAPCQYNTLWYHIFETIGHTSVKKEFNINECSRYETVHLASYTMLTNTSLSPVLKTRTRPVSVWLGLKSACSGAMYWVAATRSWSKSPVYRNPGQREREGCDISSVTEPLYVCVV